MWRGDGRGVAAGVTVACAARSTTDAPQRTSGTLEEIVARLTRPGGRVAVPPTLPTEQVVGDGRATLAELGRLDIPVNNAAITFVGDLDIPHSATTS